MAKTPVAISLLCCEQVIIEEGSKNLTLVNCFSRRVVDSFPLEPFPFVVLVTLTDGSGEMPIQLRIDRLDTMEEIYERHRTVRLNNPLHEVIFGFRIRNCLFPVAGDYEVTVVINNELILNRKIRLLTKGDNHE
jgi:hypothetical protein